MQLFCFAWFLIWPWENKADSFHIFQSILKKIKKNLIAFLFLVVIIGTVEHKFRKRNRETERNGPRFSRR